MLSEPERQAWPRVLKLAALKFYVSRQQYAMQNRERAGVLVKDPGYFRLVLLLHCQSSL